MSKKLGDIISVTFTQEQLQIEDTILADVITKYTKRGRLGQEKYGTNLDRKDIDLMGWLNHLQEELMDATLYIEKLKKTI